MSGLNIVRRRMAWGAGTPAIDYGTAITNIAGGTSAQDAGGQDYLLTKTASSDWDNGEWGSAAIPGAFDMRFRPNTATGQYSRLGFASTASGRTITDLGTNSALLFFDEFGRIRLIDAAGSVQWENGTGNAEANFTNNEYWWLCRDEDDEITVLRGGTGTKASATLVASANAVLAGLGAMSGDRYFVGFVFYNGQYAHAKVIV